MALSIKNKLVFVEESVGAAKPPNSWVVCTIPLVLWFLEPLAQEGSLHQERVSVCRLYNHEAK